MEVAVEPQETVETQQLVVLPHSRHSLANTLVELEITTSF